MQVPKANERKITQRKKQQQQNVDALSSPGVWLHKGITEEWTTNVALETTWGVFVLCPAVGRIQVKVRQQYVHIPEKNTKHLNGMDKSCQNEPENFPVPTSYSVVCALYPTLSCFHDQFTADLRAETGYRRRQLNKDTVSTLMTEKCQTAQKLEEVVLLWNLRDDRRKRGMTEEFWAKVERSRPLSFLLQIWPTLGRKMYLTIPQWSRLRSGRQIIDCNYRFCNDYSCVCFLHRPIVCHSNRHGIARMQICSKYGQLGVV